MGFSDQDGPTEVLLAGALAGGQDHGEPPVAGLMVRREVENLGVRFSAVLVDELVGYVNVRDDLTRGGTLLA